MGNAATDGGVTACARRVGFVAVREDHKSMAYAVARAVTGRDAAETYRGRNPNSHDRLQAQLVASPATGYMHQSVIMCSPEQC
jgi:hypothetical protein